MNLEKRTAVFTSRMTDTAFLGEKVCTGIYATAFEIEQKIWMAKDLDAIPEGFEDYV